MDVTTSRDMVRVWDPLVRLFHWSLAACVFGAFLVEEGDTAHRWLGYTALGLVAFRLLWGVFGSRHARFGDWVRGPRAVMTYLRERRARAFAATAGPQPGRGSDDPGPAWRGGRRRHDRLDAVMGLVLRRGVAGGTA